ncbi:MAG TPA: phenylalanine--tRNA ligase subunit beta [Gammaproteobacteria bacterium]|nr:phenylalanine--tRNA ligase subunit beta [Gammaproteobacteria bacterium]
MRINLDWLRDFVALDADPVVAADALTSSGLEVEAVEPAGAPLEGIVVAQITAVERHPNADRLSVCTVDDGAGKLQVVCGARNAAAGIKAPFARVGARLPNGKEIGAAELRGVKSNGMLCSAKELELVDDVDGLLLLDAGAPVGTPLREYLKLDDAILEINVTPNRGDCFSVLGIARELAARLEKPLRQPTRPPVPVTLDERFSVELQAGDRCPRFAGRVVRGIRTGLKSPLWLRERLRRAGLRAIHPVVDVTNYVMLELGQPLHAYDLTKLDRGIVVRLAAPNEKLMLLDGKTVDLADDVLVIADGRGPVGLAGVMGGQSTAVSAATDTIFFEAAFFSQRALAGRARRFGLHTDASMRFERGVDPTQQARAIERATELLLAISGGRAGPLVVAERPADVPARPAVTLRPERLESVLGLDVAASQVEQVLARLEMPVERTAGGWRVTPPAFRFDVSIEEDLIEEVGRMVGYDRIPPTHGTATERLGTATETRVPSDRAADVLLARGYSEAITYSFVDPKLEKAVDANAVPVPLANPIASDLAVLRTSLWPGLLGAARHNVSHQRTRLKLFEIGPRFAAESDGVRETAMLAGIALGSRAPEHWEGSGPAIDYYDVKGDVEALLACTGRRDEFRFEPASHPGLRPGRTARILRGAAAVGWLGELHPDLQELLDRKRPAVVFELELDATFAATVPAFRGYSKFPSIRRDLAVVVDAHTEAATLVDAVRAAAGEFLQHVVVFDVYRGTGVDSRRKSIGLGLILQGTSRTLTDADADQTMRSVTLRLERELGATIRTQQN